MAQDRFEAARRRLELRSRVVALLGGRCEICGYDRCLSALEAHHLDPATKDFNLSDTLDFGLIEEELKKCVLLCANCHREVHDGLHPRYLLSEGSSLDFDFESPEESISYTDELELDAVLEDVGQQFAKLSEKPLKSSRVWRKTG